MSKIVIIGAGPAGLGAGYQCSRVELSTFEIFDHSPAVGGLSASFIDQEGFTWDVGGHVLFSHYDYFDQVVSEALGNDFYEHLRESWIRIQNTWVPYPFQNNIRHLPSAARVECLAGLRHLKNSGRPAVNFREWMDAVFGRGIVNYFMDPYNFKVWGVPLETMSKDWIAERVSVVDLPRIEKNIVEKRDDLSWGPNNKFKFPRKGGTGAIFRSIARLFKERISFLHDFKKVDLEKKVISFSNGKNVRYDFLINTTPLDQFIQKCMLVPETVRSAAGDLVHNSGLIVGLGFSGKRHDSKCWMYFPEDNCPFYRVTNFHNYSPHNVPDGDVDNYFSLMCETSYSQYKPVDKARIIDETIEGLIASGMITEKESKNIVSRYLIDIPYSYPVPTISRDRALSVIQPYLESKGVYSRGRFGAWKYEVGNMDHSFMQGVEVVYRILFGKEERTVNNKV